MEVIRTYSALLIEVQSRQNPYSTVDKNNFVYKSKDKYKSYAPFALGVKHHTRLWVHKMYNQINQ